MHKTKFQGYWNLHGEFELVSSSKVVFLCYESFGNSSESVRRQLVPQVRAREDDQYGYRGSPEVFKMILIIIWTRNLD